MKRKQIIALVIISPLSLLFVCVAAVTLPVLFGGRLIFTLLMWQMDVAKGGSNTYTFQETWQNGWDNSITKTILELLFHPVR